MKPRVYRLFRTVSAAPRSRRTIAIMTLIAAMISALAISRVRARHEVVSLGYELSRANQEARALREASRRLEVERATLTSPARIHTLAAAMGMVPAPADAIRVVRPAPGVAAAP